MLPKALQHYVFIFFLSMMMSFLVSGVATLRAVGMIDGFFGVWMSAWPPSWGTAFVAALVVAPIARKLAAFLVKQEA